ncbi:7039_t:CDS:2 [Funneliformis caledonium]|uniref:7039_t:CDS:1 n=1 Tax=Funneliformis caledonium TaxID=1117310 RepID=A0A9N9GD48_9GLOM|nr:7039_t:CDS:2 [Funneliformis caledonium]
MISELNKTTVHNKIYKSQNTGKLFMQYFAFIDSSKDLAQSGQVLLKIL